MASVAAGHGPGALAQVSHRLYDFPNGSALRKMLTALPFQKLNDEPAMSFQYRVFKWIEDRITPSPFLQF